ERSPGEDSGHSPCFLKKQEAKKVVNTLEKRPKNFGFELYIQPCLWTRHHWFCQMTLLYPVVATKNYSPLTSKNQTTTQLLKLSHKYRPETKQEKRPKKKAARTKRPPVLQASLDIDTTLSVDKKVQLVVITHDVDPTKLTVFLPPLCQNIGTPCCMIKGRVILGHIVYRKTCARAIFTQINAEDKGALAKLVEAVRTNYNYRYDEIHHHCAGNILGPKYVSQIAKLEKAKTKELATKLD
uniref:Ribosomal protein eL8/eL30/eS12/Gadd45 domain-containing protein n=1 Tax=Otolemur garnettii TaxID=30611 RepID=H0XP31_OTOGA